MAITHHWKFEDDGVDDVGAWDLTAVGSPSYTASGAPDKNKAIIFNGSTQLAHKDDVNLNGASAVTICGWVYPDTFANQNCMFSIMRRNVDADLQIRLRLSGTSGGVTIQLRAGASPATESFNSGDGALVSGRWNFIAFTYVAAGDVDVWTDSTTDQSSLVKVIDETHTVAGNIAATDNGTDTDLTIGSGKNSISTYRDFWDGNCDDWRIYDTALDSTALQAVRDDDQAVAALDLAMKSLLHGHSLDAISLSSSSALSIQSLLHTHALDALSLTESSALAIRDLLHGHTLDAASLNQASVLAIQDLLHSHTIDGVTLAQIANTALAIADLLHGHTLDSADLSVTAGITIQSLLHTHALDSVDLSTASVLSIDSLLHTHLLDTLSLSPAVTMAIQSLLHSHGIEAITLTVVETDIGVGERLILVQADGRTVLIQADGRTITIQ